MPASYEGFVCDLKNKNETATAHPLMHVGVTHGLLPLVRASLEPPSGDRSTFRQNKTAAMAVLF
jgi:hypothetical protein